MPNHSPSEQVEEELTEEELENIKATKRMVGICLVFSCLIALCTVCFLLHMCVQYAAGKALVSSLEGGSKDAKMEKDARLLLAAMGKDKADAESGSITTSGSGRRSGNTLEVPGGLQSAQVQADLPED